MAQSTVFRSTDSQVSAAFDDAARGLAMWRLWSALAWEDLRQRFRRSYVGLLWTTISFGVFILVKFLIFGQLSESDPGYFMAYVTVGFFVWVFLNSAIVDAPYVFIMSETWIKAGRLPFSVFVLQSVFRSVILSVCNALVVVVVLIIAGVDIGLAAGWSVFVFALILVNAFWLNLMLGALATRQRDIPHLVQTVMRVLFFLTPIVWEPERMGALWSYLRYNPLAHFVIAFRAPLIDGALAPTSLAVVGAITACGLLMGVFVFAHVRRRIVYWL